MSKGVAVKTTVELFLGVLILVILAFLIMKIPGLGDWIINFLKGFFERPGTTEQELGIALNSMEALRFAIDVVANDGKVPTAMAVAGSETIPSDRCVDEDFAQYGNKEVDVTEKMKAVGQYEGKSWILKISSVRGSTTCAGTTKDDCGKRTDEVIVNLWKVGIEQQRIQCEKDKKWYWVTFNAELKEKTTSTGTTTPTQCSDITDDSKCWDTSGCKWQPTNNPNCDLNTGKGCCISSSTSSTGSFIYILKNKITGMITAGEKDDGRGCKYTENSGTIEASCKHKDSMANPIKVECSGNPISCNIIGFELPQQLESTAEEWILGYGDPNLLGYWQKFPMGEEVAWDSLIVYEENVGLVFLWGAALTAGASCINPFSKSVSKQTKITELMGKNTPKMITGSSKESVDEFLKLVKRHDKIAKGFGVAGTAAAAANWLDSKGEKYNEVENSMILKIPKKKTYKFELSPKARDYFVMLDKREILGGDDVPLYFASPCKIDVKIEETDKIGCGKIGEKKPEYDYCCRNEIGNEYYWSPYECDFDYGELPEEDESKCGKKPVVKQDYFLEGLSNYCLQPTQFLSAQKMKTIIVKDIEYYKEGGYDKNNFCYSSNTKEGATSIAGSIIANVLTIWNPATSCIKRVGIALGGALLSTKIADVTTWPSHWEKAWN